MDQEILPTDDDTAFYRRHGYWLSPKIFSDSELLALREHHSRVVDGCYETGRPPFSRNPEPGDTTRLVQVNNAYWTDATIARLVLDPRLGAIAARLADVTGVRLWHDQLLYKPPASGEDGVIGWHQDQGYWQCTDREDAITAWVALADVDEDNGCMEVVPGSHQWGLLGEDHFYQQDIDSQTKRIEERSGRTFQSTPCILAAGCASFHHNSTIHGSRPNLSDRARLSIAVHMIADGTRYRAGSGDGHSSNTLLQPTDGDPYAGPYFPVIYRLGQPLANVWAAGDP